MSKNISPQFEFGEKVFIGRRQELADLQALLDNKKGKKWIYNIKGIGGIGKSQLLEQFLKILAKQQHAKLPILFTPEPIDLGLTHHQVEVGILKILTEIAPEHFSEYQQTLEDYQILDNPPNFVRKQFLDLYQKLDSETIVIFFDTTEQTSPVVRRFFKTFLLDLKSRKPGTLVVAAGRPKTLQGQTLIAHYPFMFSEAEVQEIVQPSLLEGLNTQEIAQYFEKYLSSKLSELSVEEQQKLYQLPQGRPILVALMIDLIKDTNSHQGIPPDIILGYASDELEQALVEHIPNLEQHYLSPHDYPQVA